MRSGVVDRIFGLAILAASLRGSADAQSSTAAAPQAQVTFYSSGKLLELPGAPHAAFKGRIMDEYDQLAMLSPGHFVTFNLDAGPHTFSTNSWLVARPEGGGHLTIDLVAGQHYYVGTYLRSLVYAWNYRLEQHTCKEAREDNADSKPLEGKHLKKYGAARVVTETAFPACS